MKKNLINLAVCTSFGLAGLTQTALAASDNPFDGANGYVNPDYVKEVGAFLDNNAEYREKADLIGLLDANKKWKIPTAVWLDSIEAIDGEKGRSQPIDFYLTDALEKANKSGKPEVMTVVIYNLPVRDCDAYSSNGKLKNPEDIVTYQSNYIDNIAGRFAKFYIDHPTAKDKVRLALIIEPDSLPNLITNTNNPTCQKAKKPYLQGIKYALEKFSTIPQSNISMYLDIAHSAWLGWQSNAEQISNFYNNSTDVDANGIPKGLGKGFDAVRGFITNTSNYTPLMEAFHYNDYLYGGKRILDTNFYEWNKAYDEISYVALIMSLDNNGTGGKLVGDPIARPANPYYQGKHFLIDTSRNGWIANTTDYISTRGKGVQYDRLDQRHHRGNWCNVQNVQPSKTNYDNPDNKDTPSKATSAGLGALPRAFNANRPAPANPFYGNDALPIDAYVWIKPPGESDGFYDPSKPVGEQGDQMCGDLPHTGIPKDPNSGGGSHNDSQKTDSLQGEGGKPAPKAGAFFEQAFKNLIDVRGCISGQFNSRFCGGE